MKKSNSFEINEKGNLVFLFEDKELIVKGVAELDNNIFFTGHGNDKR